MFEDNTNLFIFDSNVENLSQKSQQGFLEYFYAQYQKNLHFI